MSRAARHTSSQKTTRQLLHGASKHVRAGALVSALVQLGVVVVSPAVAQAVCVDVVNQTCPSRVPEPGTLALLSVGAGVAAGAAWWRRSGKK
jgi:H+/Cl- antiporter ClcA